MDKRIDTTGTIILKPALRYWVSDNMTVFCCMVLSVILGKMTESYLYIPECFEAVFGIMLLIVIGRFIQIRMTKYVITNYCIVIKKGVLTTTEDNIRLSLVIDHRKERTLTDKIFGLTTYYIYSDDRTTPELIMKGIESNIEFIEELRNRALLQARNEGVRKFVSMT